MHQNKKHNPVLLSGVIHYLNPKLGESYLDLTAGYGGHAELVLAKTKNFSEATLIDRDQRAISVLREQFGQKGTEILQQDFLTACQGLLKSERTFDLVFADLGVSSPHLNEPSRGFSLSKEGPLDMRMDQSQSLTASFIVNNYSNKKLAELIKEYGDEPKAWTIANRIVHARPIHTTTQLATIIAQAWPGHSRVHPATRTFQAVRIAVNDELKLLNRSLPLWINLLSPGGRIVVISFHSLEDRIVKQTFSNLSGERYDAVLKLLTKHPVTAGKNEIVFNPRARSAKLRAAAKIKKRKGSSNAYSGKK